MPEGTLRFGVVVGHRHIRLVLATMSTLVVGVKVVHALVIVLVGSSISSRVVAGQNSFLVMFIFEQNIIINHQKFHPGNEPKIVHHRHR